MMKELVKKAQDAFIELGRTANQLSDAHDLQCSEYDRLRTDFDAVKQQLQSMQRELGDTLQELNGTKDALRRAQELLASDYDHPDRVEARQQEKAKRIAELQAQIDELSK